ncbi:CYP97B3 [Symbiodinium sp. CCMP2592]|nr:CYP97B3 [Symbiodinium sp. CCMP2592]
MAASAAALRPLDSVPSLGKAFLFTARSRLCAALMQKGSEHPRMFRMHLGPKTACVVTHPEIARSVLTRPKDFIKREIPRNPASALQTLLHCNKDGTYSIGFANGKDWAVLREPVAPVFEKQALQNLLPKFNDSSEKLLETWRGADEVDAKQDMSRFALDVLGSAVLGQSFGAIDGSFTDTYAHYQYIMAEQSNPIYMSFPFMERLPTSRNRRLRQSVHHLHGVLQGAIDARVQLRREQQAAGTLSEEPQDMLDMLLGPGVDVPKDGVLPKEGSLVPLLYVFFLAGHDTTAVSLAWQMYFLAKYPEVQQKAREEVQGILGGRKDPTVEDLEKVPYLSAVINEGLRIRPPLFNLYTRQAAHDTELDGVFIPGGTHISLHIAAINKHPEVWGEAEDFNPERFLQEKQPRVFHNLPFGAGPRRCIGDKFSLMEQKSLLMKLLTQYKVLPHEDTVDGEENFTSSMLGMLFLQPEEMKVRLQPVQ